jgi:hypothetical protein
MIKKLLFVALGAVAVGCSSDATSLAGPDAKECTKGSIAPGDSKSGELTDQSCVRYDYAYSQDSVHYDAYTFTAVKGQGYWFALDAANHTDYWDAVMELASIDPSTGDEQLLAISDDEGPNNYSRIYFIAPVSGTFSLRVAGYDFSDTSAYVLEARACNSPLPAITGDLAATSQTLESSDCVVAEPEFAGDSSHVKLYSIHIGPNETKTITVSADAFLPGLQIYGPGWGVSCDYEYQGCGGGSVGAGEASSATITLTASGDWNCYYGCVPANWPGDYTLAVGAANFTDAGAFTLQVQSGSTEVPTRIVAPSASLRNPTLNWLTKKPLTASQYLRRVR